MKYYRIFDAVKWTGLNLDEINATAALVGCKAHLAQDQTALVVLEGFSIVSRILPGDYLVFNANTCRGMTATAFEEYYKPYQDGTI